MARFQFGSTPLANAVHGRNPFRTTLKPWLKLKRLLVGICRGTFIIPELS